MRKKSDKNNPRAGRTIAQIRAAFKDAPEDSISALESVAFNRDIYEQLSMLSKYSEAGAFTDLLERELSMKLAKVLVFHRSESVAPHIHSYLEEINAYVNILKHLNGADAKFQKADEDIDTYLKQLAQELEGPLGRATKGA